MQKKRNRHNRPSKSLQKRQYSAICADCGVEAKVPVKPSDDTPLYCVDCYRKRSKKGAEQ